MRGDKIGRLATETVDGNDGGLVGVSGVDIEQRAAVSVCFSAMRTCDLPDTVGHRTGIYGTGAAAPVRTDSARRSAGNARTPVTSALRR